MQQQHRGEGGRTVQPSSIRSLASGRIRSSSFVCTTLHDCEDPALYFEDENGNIEHNHDVNDLIVKLSTSLPLTKASTCQTSTDDTSTCIAGIGMNPPTTDSVLIFDSSNNTVIEEFIDCPPAQQTPHMKHQHSQNADPKQRHTGKGNNSKPANEYSYQHIITAFLKGNTTCTNVDDDDLSSVAVPYNGNFNDGSRRTDFMDCFIGPTVTACPNGQPYNLLPDATTSYPMSPIRSLMAASFPKSLFVPAYGDSAIAAAGTATENDKNCGNAGRTVPTRAQREVQYWKRRLGHAARYYGKVHPETAEATFNLGHAQLRGLNYDLALENFTLAHSIWRSLRRDDRFHLTIGRALDAMGLAVLRSATRQRQQQHQHQQSRKRTDDLHEAQRLLEQAFAIRHHHLGVWHVDTVETYNKLASVHLHLGRLVEARHAYQEVYYVRQAVFGGSHPSVAISAHAVANCCYKMGAAVQASEWYQRALDVYDAMRLPYHHPTVSKLLKDRSRLEQQHLVG